MKQEIKKHLAERGILVSEKRSHDPFVVTIAMAQLFGVKITEGRELASEDMIPQLSEVLGLEVPAPFYRGFPQSVRELSPDALLYDQCLHYTQTYGFGSFSHPGHSVLEEALPRLTFTEKYPEKQFVILGAADALVRLFRMAEDMVASTRPLSAFDMSLLLEIITEYHFIPPVCNCRDTAIRLLFATQDITYASFLSLSDVTKLAEHINDTKNPGASIYHLALPNSYRRLLTATLDRIIAEGRCDLAICYERKKAWCGLLHHIHYKPKCELGKQFCDAMRSKGNRSVMSAFEKAMAAHDIPTACRTLAEGKGGGALLRNLNYVLSRCTSEEEMLGVLSTLPKADPVIYMQLLMQYATASSAEARTFIFSRHGRIKRHEETDDEVERRRSRIPENLAEAVVRLLRERLGELLAGRLGKVYIDPAMDRIGVPVSENTTNGGYGVLPKGSRLPIGEGKKLRAFTYWEKVDDIDLSCFLINHDGSEVEFSWRSLSRGENKIIVFSGDQTSGYEGGSEYFDIDLDALTAKHPNARYIIFSNNVYSHARFSDCVCRAGYMLRDTADSGEVFEARTVSSSFRIDCASTEAYLFGIDLKTREMVWLNSAVDGLYNHIAGESSHASLERYFTMTEILSLGEVYRMLATEVVASPEEADVVVLPTMPEGGTTAELVLPGDFPRILSHLAAK